jgi:hypothetical protein
MRDDLKALANEVATETERAQTLHAPIRTLHEAHGVILEEFEEFWEQAKINPKKLDATQKAERIAKLREELIQTAAMCVRTVMDLTL